MIVVAARNSRTLMHPVAEKLSIEQMWDVARYYESLREVPPTRER